MTVQSSRSEDVALVELVRPPHNLLDFETLGALADELERAAADASCRAIVLAAEGKSFCAGGNFAPPDTSAPSGLSASETFRFLAGRLYAQAERVFAIDRPIVAAVHGAAIGAGLGLALACDVRVTCPEAFFAANFVRLGIHPGFAVSATLPATIGPGRSADLMLTGRRVYGEEALRIGLADRLVAVSEVRPTALEIAREIASGAPLAVAATRATLRAGLGALVHGALAREVDEQARLMETTDAAEGIAAMLQRREARFSGR